jgi:DNA-binding HxlR family transcriptional regulator
MYSQILLLHRSLKIDTIDAAILESLDNKLFSLLDLCEAVGQPKKPQMMAARLKRHENHGWIVTSTSKKSKREKVRKLTQKGRAMLNRIRAHAVTVTCGGVEE